MAKRNLRTWMTKSAEIFNRHIIAMLQFLIGLLIRLIPLRKTSCICIKVTAGAVTNGYCESGIIVWSKSFLEGERNYYSQILCLIEDFLANYAIFAD